MPSLRKLSSAAQARKQDRKQIVQPAPARVLCGLGRCSRCSCVRFEGRGNVCEYCGHHYDDHDTSPF